MDRIRLGVNVDHVASLRQARGTKYPDPVMAAHAVELAGADQITVHLREDRRHVQERDLRMLRDTVTTMLNLEMAEAEDVIRIACEVKPDLVTLVPEKRQELTTEGGLRVQWRKGLRLVEVYRDDGTQPTAPAWQALGGQAAAQQEEEEEQQTLGVMEED